MSVCRRFCAALVFLLIARGGEAQSNSESSFTMRVPVDEISLNFHVADSSGRPIAKLNAQDLQIMDNRVLQERIFMLEALEDLPLRAGFLFDISNSVLRDISFYRSVIAAYSQNLIRKNVDKAFVMQFDTEPFLKQRWTDVDLELRNGAAQVGPSPSRLVPYTSIYDALYIACRDQWNTKQAQQTGNFIVLFTDGEDNSSHAYLSEAVDMCQQKHVVIYIIDLQRSSRSSDGYKTMDALTKQTGGRLYLHLGLYDVFSALQQIEWEQRFQYHLVYKPANFRADGTFHYLKLRCLLPGAKVTSRTGYYAFARR